MILKIISFGIIIGVIPFLTGMLFSGSRKKRFELSFLTAYVKGLITLLAVFQLIAVPFAFLGLSLTTLVYSFGGITLVLCVLSLILNFKKFPVMIISAFKGIISSPWQIWLAVVLILFQVFVLSRYLHIDNDDAFYVATSTTAVETDTIYKIDPYTGEEYHSLPARYVLASFPIFTAVVAKVARIHPAIVAHLGFAVVFVLFAYMVYVIIGRYLFQNNKKTIGYFLIFASLLQMFSAYSVYTPGVFLLTRIWQGKAILASALLPAVFCFMLQASPKDGMKRNWILLLMTMISCCMASSMGVLLSAVVAGLTALISSVVHRNWKVILYGFLCCIPNLAYAGIYLLIR